MFIETSAIVAILLQENNAGDLSDKIQASQKRVTGSHCRVEVCMVLANRLNLPIYIIEHHFDEFLLNNRVEVLDLTDDLARTAVRAFDIYGKGRKHKAQLNLADCMSYAFAKSGRMKMLFVGSDFSHTDIALA